MVMISVVVPAKNEAGRITTVLRNLSLLPIDHIILVINGSQDTTLQEALDTPNPKLQLLYFEAALGIDVPRAIGAKVAYSVGSDTILFVDGDMVGTFNENLTELINSVSLRHLDLALTNCYPAEPRHIERYNPTFHWRQNLNKELGLFKKIGLSTPAHGPHVVSRKFLETVPFCELAVPPVAMALARLGRLKIDVATTLPHYRLGSSIKNQAHANKIIDTIVGDCLEAISIYQGNERSRQWQGKSYIGYHNERRISFVDEFLP
jgi:glycosyltransferase involved in cell wall biosynthesis